ncbi:serine/arginine repetitive matrix protein 1-like [Candoia aspera]|uniref:serine/arginine repetitive matrix protein 1-like n=1 Tax=Candoia aspera TaxID=51853 RepID=UPI002FD81153
MAQSSDSDSEEAAPTEPVECQPQETLSQELPETDQTQTPTEQLEQSDDDIWPPSPQTRKEDDGTAVGRTSCGANPPPHKDRRSQASEQPRTLEAPGGAAAGVGRAPTSTRSRAPAARSARICLVARRFRLPQPETGARFPHPRLHLRRGGKPGRPPSHAKPPKAEKKRRDKPGRPAPLPAAPGQPSRVTHAVSVVPATWAGKRRSPKPLCTEQHPRGCPASGEGGGGGYGDQARGARPGRTGKTRLFCARLWLWLRLRLRLGRLAEHAAAPEPPIARSEQARGRNARTRPRRGGGGAPKRPRAAAPAAASRPVPRHKLTHRGKGSPSNLSPFFGVSVRRPSTSQSTPRGTCFLQSENSARVFQVTYPTGI